MQVIHKYDIPIQDDFTIKMPYVGKFLDVQVQYGAPRLWVLTSSESPEIEYKFKIIATGQEFDYENTCLYYIGTFQMVGGDLVYHLFYEEGELPFNQQS